MQFQLLDMISKTEKVDAQREVAYIFNSYLAAAAIGAAWEVGLFDELQQQKQVHIADFARRQDLDLKSSEGLVASLAIVGIVEHKGEIVEAGRFFNEAYTQKSVFHWLALGSGNLFARMHHVLRKQNRTGEYYTRDSVAIGYACKDINTVHFDLVFLSAMKQLDFQFQKVVDLGSGSGERLMQILNLYPDSKGLGIDVAAPALEKSANDAVARGFGDRLSFTLGDATNLQYRDEFADVDLLTCFLMGHDFWPRENCIVSLQRLRTAFPKARRFFLGDTVRILLSQTADSKYAVMEDNVPSFTLGFEFGHALMNTYIPTMEDWEGIFDEGGWRCVKQHLIETQSLSVIFELEHA